MALESGTYISSLNAANPVATDGLAESDNHLRLLKSTILATFPNVTGAINATHTEINTATDGSTAATSTLIADADRVVLNDDGTMVQAAMTDVTTYINASMTLRNDVVTASSIADSAVTAASIADNAITTDKLAVGAAFVTGMVMPYAGNTAPTGWLACFGQELNTFTYKDLHAVISNVYGGDEYNAGVTDQSGASTVFKVPDLRGRVIAGQDDMGGTSADRLQSAVNGDLNGDTLGAAGGSQSHTLTTAQLASHTHSLGTRSRVQVGTDNGVQYGGGGSSTFSGAVINTQSTGSGEAHNNVQPTIILNYIIKI